MRMKKEINLVAISGSLKSTSSNTNILNALSHFKSADTRFVLFNELENIPPFNPEKEEGNNAVKKLRLLLKQADGVIISTPEYAFGVPGVLKNALDWMVSSGELNEKPVIAISASPLYLGGDKAMASLLLTLSALGTNMSERSFLSIGNVSTKINVNGEIIDKQTDTDLKTLYHHLLELIMGQISDKE
jgi:NAD(P)H-dependent FMN reductase